jgi:hypothetical protein
MDPRRLEEQLVTLQAHVAIVRMALRSLVRSHPDPTAVLAAWRDARADAVAAAYALPPDVRQSAWLAEQTHALAEEWTAELVDAVLQGDRRGGTPIEGLDPQGLAGTAPD